MIFDSDKVQTGTILGACMTEFQIDDKRTQFKHLQTVNDELKAENDTLTSHITNLREECEQYQAKANSLQSMTTHLQSNNDHLQSMINKSKNCELQSAQINELKTKHCKAIARKDESEKKLTTMTNEYDRLKQECVQLKSDKVHLASENDRFRSNNTDLQSKNDYLQSKNLKLKNKMDLQRAQIKELTMKYQKAITLQDDFEKKATTMINPGSFKQESDQLKQKHKEQHPLIIERREEKVQDSSALN
eukprot:849475_1